MYTPIVVLLLHSASPWEGPDVPGALGRDCRIDQTVDCPLSMLVSVWGAGKVLGHRETSHPTTRPVEVRFSWVRNKGIE